MVLTPRDRALIGLVAERGALTREQVTQALSFGSVTRVNSVLLRLVRHRYLARRFQPTLSGTRRAVYVVAKIGAEVLGVDEDRSQFKACSDLFLEHRLAVNDVWLAFARLSHEGYSLAQWLSEPQLKAKPLGFVPDAYLEYSLNGLLFTAFVEADLGTETHKRWEGKVQAYTQLAFSGLFERTFKRRFFRVLVVTTSARRAGVLRHTIAKHTERIFWITTREQLRALGPFGSIWQRPADGAAKSLTNS